MCKYNFPYHHIFKSLKHQGMVEFEHLNVTGIQNDPHFIRCLNDRWYEKFVKRNNVFWKR